MNQRFSVERSLAGAEANLAEALAALDAHDRGDLTGLPTGALAWLLAQRIRRARGERRAPPLLVITAGRDEASALAEDIRCFCGEKLAQGVLSFPSGDTTPFVDMAPDRRAAMDRLTTLFRLAHDQPVHCVVAPVGAVCRRVPPKAVVRERSLVVEAASELDQEHLLQVLTEAGYLRVPVVEDPGSFAVRGAIVDVFPAQADQPVRIELDFDMVASLRRFDADDQRTLGELDHVSLPPARETLWGETERERAAEAVSDLCDDMNLPTSQRKGLVADIRAGRAFLGIEGFLPAFYTHMESLFDYLPEAYTTVVVDPVEVERAHAADLHRAERDREAKVADKRPVYSLSHHYLPAGELADRLKAHPLCVTHKLAVAGTTEEDAASALTFLSDVEGHKLVRLNAFDQTGLAQALKAQRSRSGASEPLAPLVQHIKDWLSEGLLVCVMARSQTQATRLHGLLKSYGLAAASPEPYDEDRRANFARDVAHVMTGTLQHGFVLPQAAVAFVTESEIFGQQRRRATTTRKGRDKKRAFVEDLRQLQVGDYIVHVEHGVGRYLGLGSQEVPVSRNEQSLGLRPRRVEVLEVEYAGGDKLYLPVTRLNQVEKFASAQGQTPKLDKLGGQSFSRTKAKVRKSVLQLADELLSLYAARAAQTRPSYPAADRSFAEFEATFPYEETEDQRRAIDDVMGDLLANQPMDRLICGDVGFGKTEVALRAAFRVAMSGRQVAVLCPTTVLAQQHLHTFEQRLRDYPINLEVLSRFVPKKRQGQVVSALKEGKCDIVVGTHRLLSKDVHFKQLGLLVIDEEQRFGVTHKERIKKLRTQIDVLTLSATPIPRTLQLAIGGLRELSLITTPPVDRRAVRTFVTRWEDHTVREAIQRELSRGGQVFFINNRIDRLYERAAQLQALLPDVRVATVHGQLKESTLEQIMTDFVDGRYDVLCSTALVENGLDIPRANTILIDRADRFGLSQLYQLRGRVGRSRERAYCYLLAPPPNDMSDEARTRIEALERFNQLGTGFQLASLDMELRGTGDLLGAEQSGNVSAVGFDLFTHMLEEAVAELRGQPLLSDIDPEITLTAEHYLPEEYMPDVGVRLSLYKRLASAESEAEVAELAEEMEDRFGPPPKPAQRFIQVMAIKSQLRKLRVLGCEGTSSRVTLHFEEKTPLDPIALAKRVAASPRYSLTPDMKLTRRFGEDEGDDPVDHVQTLLSELAGIG